MPEPESGAKPFSQVRPWNEPLRGGNRGSKIRTPASPMQRNQRGKTSPMNWIVTAAATLALAVGLGAFGAHGLQDRLDEYSKGIYETAVMYHFFHALGHPGDSAIDQKRLGDARRGQSRRLAAAGRNRVLLRQPVRAGRYRDQDPGRHHAHWRRRVYRRMAGTRLRGYEVAAGAAIAPGASGSSWAARRRRFRSAPENRRPSWRGLRPARPSAPNPARAWPCGYPAGVAAGRRRAAACA